MAAARSFLMILPVPVPPAGEALLKMQLPPGIVRPGTRVSFRFPREGGTVLDSWYEDTLAAAFVLEAAQTAEQEGFDAVCINTVTDTGLEAVRSRLAIPVVGAGEASFLTACSLASRFSILTLWDRWTPAYRKVLTRHGLAGRLASVRHIDTRPDLEALLTGKEEVVFAALEKAACRAIEEDDAEAIVLGSTTMYQSHRYLAKRLPVPVVNPALVGYLHCESLLDLGLAHSKRSFPAPQVLNDGVLRAVPSRF
jgi:allantoin racemase